MGLLTVESNPTAELRPGDAANVLLHPRDMAQRRLSVGDLVLIRSPADADELPGGASMGDSWRAFRQVLARKPTGEVALAVGVVSLALAGAAADGRAPPSEQRIYLSAMLRRNSGAVLGQGVQVWPLPGAVIGGEVNIVPAAVCSLMFVGEGAAAPRLSPAMHCYLRSWLLGQHFVAGNEIVVPLLGRKSLLRIVSLRSSLGQVSAVAEQPQVAASASKWSSSPRTGSLERAPEPEQELHSGRASYAPGPGPGQARERGRSRERGRRRERRRRLEHERGRTTEERQQRGHARCAEECADTEALRGTTSAANGSCGTTPLLFVVGAETQLQVLEPGGCSSTSSSSSSAPSVAKASALEEGSPDIAAPPIGGLDEQLGSIQELLDVALHRPEVVQNKGLRPPVGVLLHGPPGTGKTLIARSLAARSGSDVSFVIINGADVVGKFVGESEGRLRGIFDNAHATPDGKTIIFIDEIDALCPSREGGQSELHNRIVATLLTALDGGARPALLPNTDGSQVTRDGRIFVIAATNRPHALDEALRRPGRLDRELEVGVPSELDRRNILSAVLSAVPHTVTPETLQSIAAKTHGFVGADLALLVKEATMKALRRSRILCTPSAQMGPLPGPGPAAEPEPEPEPHVTSPDLLRPELGPGWALKEADLVESLVLVAPSSLREVALEIPKVNWEDIGGCSTMRQQMREAVEWPLTHPEAFTRMGIRPPRGVLLYGPPGCSKTLTARALATESSLNFIAVKGPELFSKWVGDSEKAVADIYRKARRAAPAIVFFDEIDALAVKRGGAGSVGDRVLSQLLIELDGAAPAHSPQASVVTIAATNRPDLLDPALVRPGRFDRQVYVAPPDSAARLEILRIGTRGVPTADDVDLPAIAAEMEGYSGAEAMAISREASMAALVEAVESAEAAAVGKSTAASVESDAIRITARHFAVARAKVQPSISAEDIAFFEAYAAQQR